MTDSDPRSTAPDDQLDAAFAESTGMARRLAIALLGYEPVPDEPGTGVLDWLVGKLAGMRWQAGMRCPHLAGIRLDTPRPVIAALWAPDALTCPPCASLLSLGLDDDERWRCDRCRRSTPGRLAPRLAVVGAVTVHFGLCSHCCADFGLTEAPCRVEPQRDMLGSVGERVLRAALGDYADDPPPAIAHLLPPASNRATRRASRHSRRRS